MTYKQKKNQLEIKIKEELSHFDLIGKYLLLAVSGGIDSMVMLDFFSKNFDESQIKLAVCHINHQLRKESADDEKFLKAECRKLNIKYYLKKVDVRKEMKLTKESLEMVAHRLRKNALLELREEINADFILTSTPARRPIETILMRIGFGTGREGINGLAKRNKFFIKTFLTVSREEIEEYQKENQVPFISDESNLDTKILRNFWRHDVLPLIRTRYSKGFEKNLLKTVSNLNWQNEDYKLLESEFQNLDQNNRVFKVDINRLKLYFSGFLKRFLETILERIFDISYHLNQNEFKMVLGLIHHKKSGKQLIIDGQISIKKSFDHLEFSKLCNHVEKEIKVEIGKCYSIASHIFLIDRVSEPKFSSNQSIEFIDEEKINGKIRLRQINKFDTFYPIGFTHKQSINRYLKSKRIGQEERKLEYILEDDNGVIWLINHRLDERYKTDKTTKHSLKLELLNDSKK